MNQMTQCMLTSEPIPKKQKKLIELGTLAVGLAHEMNNPAAAGGRAAEQLHETIQRFLSLALKLNQQMTKAQLELVSDLHREAVERASTASEFDTLMYSDQEEEIIAWLEAHGITERWKLAPILVKAQLDTEWLDTVGEDFAAEEMGHVLNWIEAILKVFELLDEIKQSTVRISDLAQAVKSYSYMEQTPLQVVDIHKGLDSSLTLLSYKLKQGVVVTRKYNRNLPQICAYESELNQVWTNLIDNAIESIAGQGKIWICTSLEDRCILVEIIDNGPGIPPDIQSRIFEPFFTTKKMGVGTGLGLDISRRIIFELHHGSIRFFSQPGETRFQIRLPIDSCPNKS
ncbi:ATPase [Pleurocapsales cyanobacterium LEGE 06147]|nr:ATPase [Pleurocapsales cyanobacterium LEGE 06147]